jgi:hypothetical protein
VLRPPSPEEQVRHKDDDDRINSSVDKPKCHLKIGVINQMQVKKVESAPG